MRTRDTGRDAGDTDGFGDDRDIAGAGAPADFVDTAIVVTATTNYTHASMANVPAVIFQTATASTATFLSTQFDPTEGRIHNDAEIMGDANPDTVAIVLQFPDQAFGAYGFDGSHLDLENWTSADKFSITVKGADIPALSHVGIDGTSGNDVINVGSWFSGSEYSIDGEGGTNTLIFNGDYSAGTTLTTAIEDIQKIVVTAGFNYNFFEQHALVSDGQTLTVDGSALGSGNWLDFDAIGQNGAAVKITGGAGDDTLVGGAYRSTLAGGAGDDQLALAGGVNVAEGGDGNDTLYAFDAFAASDHFDGGAGTDTLNLDGDYSAGLTFSAAMIANVEQIVLGPFFSYKLTTSDGNVAAGQTLRVDGSGLRAADALSFNGSHETDGAFHIIGGAGDDSLTGGAGADTFDLTVGGNDTVKGGGGDDTIEAGATLTAADRIDGGDGFDTVDLDGDYSAGLTFTAFTVTNVEDIALAAGHSCKLVTADANVAAGHTLEIDGSALGAGDQLNFNGHHETDGAFQILGGAGADILVGGAGADSIRGGGGADTLTGGAGADTFVYDGPSDSSGTAYDRIKDFDAAQDRIALPGAVSAVDAAVASGLLNSGHFNANLASAIGAAQLHAGDAVLFTPDSGNLAGHTFLVIDANGVAGYQAGADYAIEVTGMTGTLAAADFI
ncbi:MAG TPA: calcium-binding protein [Rhizomicrobium sp.]|nr:calcium-binding protein [Rhizomicrobium sp.]